MSPRLGLVPPRHAAVNGNHIGCRAISILDSQLVPAQHHRITTAGINMPCHGFATAQDHSPHNGVVVDCQYFERHGAAAEQPAGLNIRLADAGLRARCSVARRGR